MKEAVWPVRATCVFRYVIDWIKISQLIPRDFHLAGGARAAGATSGAARIEAAAASHHDRDIRDDAYIKVWYFAEEADAQKFSAVCQVVQGISRY